MDDETKGPADEANGDKDRETPTPFLTRVGGGGVLWAFLGANKNGMAHSMR